jgi:hypothetical protein
VFLVPRLLDASPIFNHKPIMRIKKIKKIKIIIIKKGEVKISSTIDKHVGDEVQGLEHYQRGKETNVFDRTALRYILVGMASIKVAIAKMMSEIIECKNCSMQNGAIKS